MKIISAEINAEGHYSIIVEFQQKQTARLNSVIPTRKTAIERGNAELAKVTDAEYLNAALEQLRSQLEDAPDVPPADQALADSLIGRNVTKG